MNRGGQKQSERKRNKTDETECRILPKILRKAEIEIRTASREILIKPFSDCLQELALSLNKNLLKVAPSKSNVSSLNERFQKQKLLKRLSLLSSQTY